MILRLEGDVMESLLLVLDEINGVMIDATTEEGELIATPVGNTEAKHLDVKLHDFLNVVASIRDMPQLQEIDGRLRVVPS